MQPFVCPQCGHKSAFDPWSGPARCPACDFTPPASGGIRGGYVQWARRHGYQAYLNELQAHWQGQHEPDPSFALPSQYDALEFFREYQRALGEDPRSVPGPQAAYVRDYVPTRQEILIFCGAYLLLRHGDRQEAARDLLALTLASPKFVDVWLWLSATTDDPDERKRYLDKATELDAGHALARDALLVLENKVPRGRTREGETVQTSQCPQCGAGLHYEPGAGEITCPHCGFQVALQGEDVLNGKAKAVHQLRLERRHRQHTWEQAQRIVRCRTCGSEMTMSEHLADQCAFCGSTNILDEDSTHVFEQPDGLLPFEIDRHQALTAIQQAQGMLWRRLGSWLRGGQREIRDIQGIYLPFWVFDGIVEGYRHVKTWSTMRKETMGWTTLENIIRPAVDSPPPDQIERVRPFSLNLLVPYEPQFLANWPSRLYNRDVELVAEEARRLMIAQTQRRDAEKGRQAQETPPPNSAWSAGMTMSTTRRSTVSYQIVGTSYQLILLPVWLGLLDDKGPPAVALVNGQTGRVALPDR